MSEHSSKDFSFSQLIYWTKIQIEVGEGALIINTGEVSKNTSQIAAGLWHFTLGAFLGGYKQKQTSLLSKSWCSVGSKLTKDYVIVLSLNIPAPPAVWPGLAGEGSLTHCSLCESSSLTEFLFCQTPWCTCHSSFPTPAANFNFLSSALKQRIITTNYRSLRDY